MIKPEQIPDEVVEAAAMQLPGMAGYQRYVRAALAAALNAWPGAFNAVQTEDEKVGSEADGETPTCFVLLLPQENNDD